MYRTADLYLRAPTLFFRCCLPLSASPLSPLGSNMPGEPEHNPTTRCSPPPPPPRPEWYRCQKYELHNAAKRGSTERTLALLSQGSVDIDQGTNRGLTPLMLAVTEGCARVVRVLLNKGANVAIAADDGRTALHGSAEGGHLATTKMLVQAGADLEAADCEGITPLHMAASQGHSRIMTVLIEAGANPDSRMLSGDTPLFIAAGEGQTSAVRMLLLAGAGPLLARTGEPGSELVPLDAAAHNGHKGVVHELVRQLGIRGCGGSSTGVNALRLAAQKGYLDIMSILTNAGVADTGMALVAASICGTEACMKFLLRQQLGLPLADRIGYIDNTLDPSGATPLLGSIGTAGGSYPRIARLLIEAGASPTLPVRLPGFGERHLDGITPLTFTNECINGHDKLGGDKDAAGKQLDRLEAIRRLLVTVDAVHAVSWLWPMSAPLLVHAEEGPATIKQTSTAPTPLTRVWPILKRRARRPGLLWAPVFRWAIACTYVLVYSGVRYIGLRQVVFSSVE